MDSARLSRSSRFGILGTSHYWLPAIGMTVFVRLVLAPEALAQATAPDNGAKEYARIIARAQTDLNAGRIAKARKQLDATDASVRNFEYEYLIARANAATADGAAPTSSERSRSPTSRTATVC